MGMVVQHNMNALSAYNKLNTNVAGLKKSSEKLSSGYRINRAGDDAAGLAISEKMRSQIRGLNQAKRNSQDGISMIQTFEGALQESHSILQRMKELATESANGTYQTEVDRDAIQLEFNQLNDELDQISDTDFNGTVMLNGGQMADGTKAVDGKFDYTKRTARALVASDVNKVDYQMFDNKTGATKGVTKADDVWEKISGGTWDRSDPNKSKGPDSVDVTLQYDASKKQWSAISATNGAQLGKFTVTNDGTKNGGFVLTDGTNEIANVVIDESKLVNGDTITLTLNNPANNTAAPKNAGSVIVDNNVTEGGSNKDIKKADMNLTTTIGTLNDSDMTDTVNKILDALDGATYEFTYQNGAAKADGSNYTLTLSDGTKLAGGDYTTAKAASLADGTELWVDGSATDGTIVIKTVTGGAAGTTLLTIKPTADTNDSKSNGTVTWKIGIEQNAYDTDKAPTVTVKNPDESAVSKANSNAAATAPLTYTDHLVLQSGARTKDSVDFTFNYKTDGMGDLKANLNVSSRADGLNTKNLSLNTQEDANAAIDKIDNAINKVSMVRATFGATQNRLEHKVENLTTTAENLTEAESGIRDTDMAQEMLNYTKFNVLQQAAQSMLAQANQQPQSILQLLG